MCWSSWRGKEAFYRRRNRLIFTFPIRSGDRFVDLLAGDTRDMDSGREMLFLTRAAVFAPAAYRVSSTS